MRVHAGGRHVLWADDIERGVGVGLARMGGTCGRFTTGNDSVTTLRQANQETGSIKSLYSQYLFSHHSHH